MLSFVKTYAGSINTKVIAPESFQYLKNISDPLLNDATALANVDILGFHLYGTQVKDFAYPLFEQKGRPLGKKAWMTEHYVDTDNMSDCVKLMKELHDCMVTGNMNGYVYWWITWPNGLADASGTIFKRAYILGQFAKYIRPGYYRVDATATPATNVYVSAYTGDKKVVIVAVNAGTGAVSQKFTIQNGTVVKLSSWQTSSSANMAAGQDYQVSGGSFTASLPGQSITTFVGSADGTFTGPRSVNVNQNSSIKTEISKGKIIVTPPDNNELYNASIYTLNGELVLVRNGMRGSMSIPVAIKGVYVINVNAQGTIHRKTVSFFD
jgi:glucuronoarabinoxylan endo-1,4-beta-xylanase